MSRGRNFYWPFVAGALVCGVAAFQPADAEDTKGKWQFGFGLSYFATTDYIRSNSDIAIAGTTSAETGNLPPVTSVDERPDQNMLNEPTAQDDFMLNFNASYGLTRWLAVELAAGYMKTSVGDIEYYIEDREKFPSRGDPDDDTIGVPPVAVGAVSCGPPDPNTHAINSPCYTYNGTEESSSVKYNLFIPVGQIKELPVHLSALVRFRPESPLDPYVGLGIGYLFTNLQTGAEFNTRSEEIASLHVRGASEGEYTSSASNTKSAPTPGFVPTPLQAEVKSGFEYHAVGGIDYFINDHFSMYVDARYVWSDVAVDITTDGAHQVRFAAYDVGKLQKVTVGSADSPTNYNLWEDGGIGSPDCPQCAGDHLYATEDSNGNGTLDPMLGEGAGKLYFYPVGPKDASNTQIRWTAADAVNVIDCPSCSWNDGSDTANPIAHFETEDRNGNTYMDRYFSYGVDVCTITGADTNPVCRPDDILTAGGPHYVWPEGCAQTRGNLSSLPLSTDFPEGCPPAPVGGQVGAAVSGADAVDDIYLVQGGKIHLGGFSLGLGVKFTF